MASWREGTRMKGEVIGLWAALAAATFFGQHAAGRANDGKPVLLGTKQKACELAYELDKAAAKAQKALGAQGSIAIGVSDVDAANESNGEASARLAATKSAVTATLGHQAAGTAVEQLRLTARLIAQARRTQKVLREAAHDVRAKASLHSAASKEMARTFVFFRSSSAQDKTRSSGLTSTGQEGCVVDTDHAKTSAKVVLETHTDLAGCFAQNKLSDVDSDDGGNAINHAVQALNSQLIQGTTPNDQDCRLTWKQRTAAEFGVPDAKVITWSLGVWSQTGSASSATLAVDEAQTTEIGELQALANTVQQKVAAIDAACADSRKPQKQSVCASPARPVSKKEGIHRWHARRRQQRNTSTSTRKDKNNARTQRSRPEHGTCRHTKQHATTSRG
ncbi:hypothetical protein TRVL_03015 [Trypanosoma vivax]|nr:hypothetical protein TRVL_03015 [Trypanosoma vivax]